jgi:ectoine hydroxylase-related dioxygenase (phytanoyl-CoA dioxygenase family)
MFVLNKKRLDFDYPSLPWIDKKKPDVDAYIKSLPKLQEEYDLREKLIQWQKFGFVIFPKAADHKLIDAYLQDIEDLYNNNKDYSTLIDSRRHGKKPIHALSRSDLDEHHIRILDFHNNSIAGKKLALNRLVTSFLRHVFSNEVIAMQSLTFIRGSEQISHQDYAFVVAQIPSHLAASWIALEDIYPDAGPLSYYPGSHRIKKFDFGNGLVLTPESKYGELEFAQHIEQQCRKMGLKEQSFTPKKGDIFIWHAALAHKGSKVKNQSLTRKTLVTHYSSESAYPFERRKPDTIPTKHYYNGAAVYVNPLCPDEEDIFQRGKEI